MKKTIFLGVFIYLLSSFNVSFAQITSESLIGKWGLVDYNMIPKKVNGKLTDKEVETVGMMQKALKAQPKFMGFTFNTDGTLLVTPKTDDSDQTAFWQLKSKNILSITSGKKKKTEEYSLKLLANGNLEFKALQSKVALPVLTFAKEGSDVNTFKFVKEPTNPAFPFAGKEFEVQGKLVAQDALSGVKTLHYAIQRPEYDDILITSLSLNEANEVQSIVFFHINKEQSNELKFSTVSTDEMLDVVINFNPFLSETIDQSSNEKKENKFDGFLIRKFKTKKDLEDFKKFLKRN